MKRYVGLKYYQCFPRLRGLNCIAHYNTALAVALAAERTQRPSNIHRSRVLLCWLRYEIVKAPNAFTLRYVAPNGGHYGKIVPTIIRLCL